MLNLLKNKKGGYAIYLIVVMPIVILITFFVIFTRMEESVVFKKAQTEVDSILYYATKEYGSLKKNPSTGEEVCSYQLNSIYKALENSGDTLLYYESPLFNPIYDDTENINNLPEGSFLYLFDAYVRNLDGWNPLWTYKISVKRNGAEKTFDPAKDSSNEYLSATIYAVLPKLDSDEGKYGKYGEPDSWYSTHSNTWANTLEIARNYIEEFNESGASPTGSSIIDEMDMSKKDKVAEFWEKFQAKAQIANLIFQKVEVTTSCI